MYGFTQHKKASKNLCCTARTTLKITQEKLHSKKQEVSVISLKFEKLIETDLQSLEIETVL